jgi:hypothetical protein
MRVLVTMVILLSAASAARGSGHPITSERTALVRATYENVPPDILGLVEPVEVDGGSAYWDGGTSYVRLTDARGTEFVACLDGRMRVLDPDVDTDFWTVSMEYIESRHLYLHAKYPSDSTAVEIPIRGPEEAAFYGLLLRWAKSQPRTEEVAAMKTAVECPKEDVTLYQVHRLLETFDWRFGIQRPR